MNVAETAAKMRQLNTRHEVVFCLGYTNGLAAYFPTDDMIHEGGYEGHAATFVYSLPAPLNVGTEASILEASYAGGHAVAPLIEPPPASPRPLSEKHAFFVMSTGRSGTQTLSQVLKFAQNASVWHHPQPYMIMETQSAYWGQIDTQSAFWQGRGHYIRQAWDQGLIHGETDHNMTPFCGAIARDIPNAKFIILVRDPREFVRSGMRRNYYRGTGAWEDGRLRPQQGDADFDTWSDRDQFSQICWLWNETYRHIERIRAEVGEDRIMVIRFEDLIAGPETTGRLFDFLGLDGFDRGSIEGVLGQKLNAQQSGNFPHPSLWSEAQHRTCWDIVKEMAVRYGYPESYTKQQRGAA